MGDRIGDNPVLFFMLLKNEHIRTNYCKTVVITIIYLLNYNCSINYCENQV